MFSAFGVQLSSNRVAKKKIRLNNSLGFQLCAKVQVTVYDYFWDESMNAVSSRNYRKEWLNLTYTGADDDGAFTYEIS